jgi:hypothetical protein
LLRRLEKSRKGKTHYEQAAKDNVRVPPDGFLDVCQEFPGVFLVEPVSETLQLVAGAGHIASEVRVTFLLETSRCLLRGMRKGAYFRGQTVLLAVDQFDTAGPYFVPYFLGSAPCLLGGVVGCLLQGSARFLGGVLCSFSGLADVFLGGA